MFIKSMIDSVSYFEVTVAFDGPSRVISLQFSVHRRSRHRDGRLPVSTSGGSIKLCDNDVDFPMEMEDYRDN